MNFYHCANASRAQKLPGGNRRVTFDVYKYFAGAWLGVGAVDDPSIIEGLDELARKSKSGITRISEAEYRECLAKKKLPGSLRSLPASPSPPRQPVPLPIQDLAGRRAAKVVENPEPKPEVVAAPKVFDALDDVLKLGAVKPVEGSDTGKKVKDMGERSLRAQADSPPSWKPKYRSYDVPENQETPP